MRKPIDDPAANLAAGKHIAESSEIDISAADAVVHSFATAEFETATSRVGGEEIKLRRIVLTTAWEVAPE